MEWPPDCPWQMALFVHKVLQGNKPADMPVEQPSKFELVINLKTAKALGLAIPESFLLLVRQTANCDTYERRS
jgi:ABC-type uncharacterized transport system substrate-binding protein